MEQPPPLVPGVPSLSEQIKIISSYRKPQVIAVTFACLIKQLYTQTSSYHGPAGGVPAAGIGGGVPAERIPWGTPPPTWCGGAR
jgi:hypothetical protein